MPASSPSDRSSPGSLGTETTPASGLDALENSREARRRHQSQLAARRQSWIDRNAYYYGHVRRALRFIVEPGKRVLNIRCQTGHLLDAVEPSYGVGVEISQALVDVARARYPRFTFLQSDPESLETAGPFDYVLVNDLCDTVDVLASLRRLTPLCEAHTRVLVYSYNRLWQPALEWAEALGLRMQVLEPNWLSEHDVRGLLALAGFNTLRTYRLILVPRKIPLLSEFCNRVLARMPVLSRLCLVSVIVARREPQPVPPESVSVSVVVPCRNERGNIASAVERIPELGRHTEIVFCDDRSTDGTADEIRRLREQYPRRDIRLVEGPAISKARNVWTGFRASRGDILVILDGDLTVRPEELPQFILALTERRAEFVNGSRLVYPLPKAAMKFTNMVANKMFSHLFSYLLDQHVKDTLCGTKALWRRDWERIEPLVGSWGVEDRWGDYELLFGASRRQLAIVDMPVHYRERVYGVSKMISVVENGLIMLRMCLAAGLRLRGGY